MLDIFNTMDWPLFAVVSLLILLSYLLLVRYFRTKRRDMDEKERSYAVLGEYGERPTHSFWTKVAIATTMTVLLIILAGTYASREKDKLKDIQILIGKQDSLRMAIEGLLRDSLDVTVHDSSAKPDIGFILHAVNVSNQQQTAILEARLAELEGNVSVQAEAKAKWTAYLSLLFKLLALIGVLGVFISNKARSFWGAMAAVAIVIDAGVELKFAFDPEFKIEFVKNIRPCDCTSAQPAEDTIVGLQIGPFESGYDTLPAVLQPQAWKDLRKLDTLAKIAEIHIWGGVDQQALRRNARMKFGDNLTLSQARANRVRNYIMQLYTDLKKPLPRIYTHTMGADYYSNTRYTPEEYARSRKVVVYGIYKK